MGDAVAATAIGIALSVVVGGIILAASGYDDADELPVVALPLLQVPLWVGLAGVPWWASRRKGTGSLAADFGLRMAPRDIPLGLAVGVAAQVVLTVVLVPVYDLLGVDTDEIGEASEKLADRADDAFAVAALVFMVVVVAPVVEELCYRGLWLRAIENRAGAIVAIVGSAVVFGAVHFQAYDFLPLAGFGLVAAWLTVRYGRLGPAIWAHVAFNTVALVNLLA